jgi:hypothetical protein
MAGGDAHNMSLTMSEKDSPEYWWQKKLRSLGPGLSSGGSVFRLNTAKKSKLVIA